MKRLLVDTHVLLWWLDGARQLSDAAIDAVSDPDADVFVSVASHWEIAIKTVVGKLSVDGDLRKHVREQYFEELTITGEHVMATAELPLHHRDPFDRVLIAQARCEGLAIVTADRRFDSYDVPVLAAT